MQTAFEDKWQTLLADVPVGDGSDHLDREHADLVGAIDAVEGELADIDRRHGDRPTQAARIRRQALEAFVASYRASLDEIEHQRAVADHGLVRSRVGALADAIQGEDSEGEALDIAKVNAALRSLFAGVVVDHLTGFLRFQWRQGGETAVMYEWRDLAV